MNIVLLSGGSGKRLWPLSNDVRSKQFIKIFKNEDSNYESMVQRVYTQIKKVDEGANVTIATSKSQVSAINNQLKDNVDICVEPCRRDTFPAIVLATSYLKDVKGIDENETVVVCPVDPYVDESYFQKIKKLDEISKESATNIVLMGIDPTYPSEKYGYILTESKEELSKVQTFKEKPDTETAKEYISQGALWNSGVFAFKIGYLMNKAHEIIDFVDYYDLYEKYDKLEKISFDYAVVEKEEEIQVVRYNGQWKDLGTWNALTEAMEEEKIGEGLLDETCKNVHILNELDIPILCVGLQDVVVSASPQGILVSDKDKSDNIKKYVEKMNQQIMFAEKSWGEYKVIDIGNESMTVRIKLNAGQMMNYHSHEHRDEIWNIVSGKGKTIVDGMEQTVKAGDVITMQAGCRHTIIAETELHVIEVQLGKEISVYDKKKYQLEI